MTAALHLHAAASTEAALAPIISVLLLVQERPERLVELYREYSAVLHGTGRSFEFIVVFDPRFSHFALTLTKLANDGEPVRVLTLGQVASEAAMLRAAAERCRGSVLLVLPGYRRIEASALPELLRRADDGADLVLARRSPRRDSWLNRTQSWLLHQVVRRMIGGDFHDIASGVRVMRRGLLDELPVYGDFSRFLPLVAHREGFRVLEVDAPQHPDDHGVRVYSPGVYVRRILDIVALYFLLRFTEKPLRFFGLVGSALSAAGGVVLAVLVVQRVLGEPMADRPLLLLGVLLFVLGIQAIGLGLVGEIIVHLNHRGSTSYRLTEESEAATPTGK